MAQSRAAVAAVAVMGVAAAPAPVPGGPYVHSLRAAAVEPYLRGAGELPVALGFSRVDLVRRPVPGAEPSAGCDAVGAGYWLGVYEDRGLVYDRDLPHHNNGVLGGNPTAARVVRPAAAGSPDQVPLATAGPAARPSWTAACHEAGTAGRSTGVEVDPGFVHLAGSAVTAAVDPAGRYRGNARAYVQSLGPSAGALDTVSSAVSVTAAPDGRTTVSYRLTLVRAEVGGGPRAVYDGDELSLAGREVPADVLVRQFRHEVRERSGDLAPFVALGLTLLEPVVTTEDGRTSVTAPAVAIAGGVHLRDRFLGRDQGLRLAAATFSSTAPRAPGP